MDDITEERIHLAEQEINKYDHDINIDKMTLPLQLMNVECIKEDSNNDMYDQDNSVNEKTRSLSWFKTEYGAEAIPEQENDYSVFNKMIEEGLLQVNMEYTEEEGINFSELENNKYFVTSAHQIKRGSEHLFQCSRCNFQTNLQAKLTNHFKGEHARNNNNLKIKQKQFFCSECDFKTKSEKRFSMHREDHSRNKDLQDECQTNLMDFKIAVATHSEEIKFDNTISEVKTSRQFAYKNQLNRPRNSKFLCTTCNYKTNSDYYFKVHLNTHSEEFKFQCLQCDFKTNRKSSYTRHQCTISEESHCKMYEYKTNLDARFKFHQRAHSLKYRFSCEECGYRMRRRRRDLLHCSRCNFQINLQSKLIDQFKGEPTGNNNFKIKQKQLVCSECDFKTKSEKRFTMHSQNHTRNKDVQDECKNNLMDDFKIHDSTHSEEFKFDVTKSEVKSSQETCKNRLNHLRKYKFLCTTCSYKTNSNYYFNVHLNTHWEEFKFHCLQCDFKTNRKSSYTRHQCPIPEEYRYCCKMCEYKTNRNDRFQFHQRAHALKYQFTCEECGYKTRKGRDFKMHQNRHTGKSDSKTISNQVECNQMTHVAICRFICTECTYKTNISANFTAHRLVHSGEDKFGCTECDYKTKNRYRLKAHMLTHDTDFRYICTKCDYKTNHQSLFKTHEMNHTGKYKFTCPHCHYKSNDIQYFKIHLRIHGKNKFQCTQCEYNASRKDSLKFHISKHSGIYKFACSSCPFKSNRRINFKEHQMTHSR